MSTSQKLDDIEENIDYMEYDLEHIKKDIDEIKDNLDYLGIALNISINATANAIDEVTVVAYLNELAALVTRDVAHCGGLNNQQCLSGICCYVFRSGEDGICVNDMNWQTFLCA